MSILARVYLSIYKFLRKPLSIIFRPFGVVVARVTCITSHHNDKVTRSIRVMGITNFLSLTVSPPPKDVALDVELGEDYSGLIFGHVGVLRVLSRVISLSIKD